VAKFKIKGKLAYLKWEFVVVDTEIEAENQDEALEKAAEAISGWPPERDVETLHTDWSGDTKITRIRVKKDEKIDG
jgi:hypothetical protein